MPATASGARSAGPGMRTSATRPRHADSDQGQDEGARAGRPGRASGPERRADHPRGDLDGDQHLGGPGPLVPGDASAATRRSPGTSGCRRRPRAPAATTARPTRSAARRPRRPPGRRAAAAASPGPAGPGAGGRRASRPPRTAGRTAPSGRRRPGRRPTRRAACAPYWSQTRTSSSGQGRPVATEAKAYDASSRRPGRRAVLMRRTTVASGAKPLKPTSSSSRCRRRRSGR